MKAVFKREFVSYFTGGIGYVYCGVFALICNISYYNYCLSAYNSDFLKVISDMLILLILLIPLATMRVWSEEKKQKTDQLLLTAPVSTGEIVLGKFFASFCLFLLSLVLTLVYPIISALYGTLELWAVIGNYVAISLAAAAYIAVSQFMSSLSESQIISALLSVITLFAFYLLDLLFDSTTVGSLSSAASFLSIITRFENFSRGIFVLSDIVYFISFTAIFLFLTSRVIEKRRWSA